MTDGRFFEIWQRGDGGGFGNFGTGMTESRFYGVSRGDDGGRFYGAWVRGDVQVAGAGFK